MNLKSIPEEQSSFGTMWKLHDFFVIQILREIKVCQSRASKAAIFIHLEALNLNFNEFLRF